MSGIPAEDIINEADLIRAVRSGSAAADRMIYGRYVRHLAAVCSRYVLNDEDVKDVLQESFIRIFNSVGGFEFRGEGSLKAWVTRVAVNESLKFLRAHRRVDFSPLWAEPSAADMPDTPLPESDGVPADVIHAMIRSLPDGYRLVFNLYVFEEKSHREIAGLLGIKESTSASQLHRAKAQLADNIRKYLDKHENRDERPVAE